MSVTGSLAQIGASPDTTEPSIGRCAQIAIGDKSATRAMLETRERFLAGDRAELRIRPEILRSWARSQQAGVDPDRVNAPYGSDVDEDSLLLRCARPIIARLMTTYALCPVAALVVDCEGRIMGRWATEHTIIDKLDVIDAGPGHLYAEQYTGTTALGTTLEDMTLQQSYSVVSIFASPFKTWRRWVPSSGIRLSGESRALSIL